MSRELEKKLKVGTLVRLGRQYCEDHNQPEKAEEIFELIEGYFERDNGLYIDTVTCPSLWNHKARDYDSIFHLFENDLSGFLDCQVISRRKAKSWTKPFRPARCGRCLANIDHYQDKEGLCFSCESELSEAP